MHLPFSIRYRPTSFSAVAGQCATTRIMANSVMMQRVPKAILLTGLHGVGKTTLARIYAKACNCDSFSGDLCGTCPSCASNPHPDIYEFDAASNNGVDFIRDLGHITENKPVHSRKCFILDEAHQLTSQAQEAFLKLLEESNSLFILVTTNPTDLLKTVRSRCLSMPLRPMSEEDIAENIRKILDNEKLQYSPDFVIALSRLGNGSLRDVQQILESVVLMHDELTTDSLSSLTLTADQYKQIAGLLCSSSMASSMKLIENWYWSGQDLVDLYIEGIPKVLRDFSVFLAKADVPMSTGISQELFQAKMFLTLEQIRSMEKAWEELRDMMVGSKNPKLVWELFVIKTFQG